MGESLGGKEENRMEAGEVGFSLSQASPLGLK